MTETKQCSQCKNVLPATAEFFYRESKQKGGLRPNCKACHRKNVYVAREENPDNARTLARGYFHRYHERLKVTVMEAYCGGQPFCQCCGDRHMEFLNLDHINEDGSAHRRQLNAGKKNNSNRAVYVWAKQNGYPPVLQVLCYNCNRAKHIYGECPHERERKTTLG